ncbi:hypothetical protein AOLI_G00135290 [Acnodon oligacanthus]
MWLVPLLTGKAQSAYVAMDSEHSEDYKEVKTAILIKPEQKPVKDISEMMILEQFLRMVNTEMEVWIKERNSKTTEEAAQLAEVFISARRSKGSCSFSQDQHFSCQLMLPRPAESPFLFLKTMETHDEMSRRFPLPRLRAEGAVPSIELRGFVEHNNVCSHNLHQHLGYEFHRAFAIFTSLRDIQNLQICSARSVLKIIEMVKQGGIERL